MAAKTVGITLESYLQRMGKMWAYMDVGCTCDNK